MISSHKVTEIYFIIDEFFKEFDALIRDYSLQEAKTGKRNRKFTMSKSEVIDGVHLVTKQRKNMKNALMLLHDRIMLRKRALIESVNDELKNMCLIEHTRHHRCFDNFIINTLSALAVYSFFDKKPSINSIDDIVEKNMLVLE